MSNFKHDAANINLNDAYQALLEVCNNFEWSLKTGLISKVVQRDPDQPGKFPLVTQREAVKFGGFWITPIECDAIICAIKIALKLERYFRFNDNHYPLDLIGDSLYVEVIEAAHGMNTRFARVQYGLMSLPMSQNLQREIKRLEVFVRKLSSLEHCWQSLLSSDDYPSIADYQDAVTALLSAAVGMLTLRPCSWSFDASVCPIYKGAALSYQTSPWSRIRALMGMSSGVVDVSDIVRSIYQVKLEELI